MKTLAQSRLAQVLVASLALTVLASIAPSANAATRTITCYKGKIVKKVTAVKPRCPAGFTRTKPTPRPTLTPKPTLTPTPTPKPTLTPTPTPKPTAATVAFSGTYTGTIALLWGEASVQATSVKATGTGNILGMSDLSGVGSAAPASQCDTFNGSGTLSGGGNTLKLTFDSTAKVCAENADAPTGITFTGNAVINGGTGKYAGATGTLKVTAGTFAIKATVAGKSEIDAFKMTISGNFVTK